MPLASSMPSNYIRRAPPPIPQAESASFDKVRPVLERMAEIGLPLCVHGEVTDPQIDIFDREAVFIDVFSTPSGAQRPACAS